MPSSATLITINDSCVPGGTGRKVSLLAPMNMKPASLGFPESILNKFGQFEDSVTESYTEDLQWHSPLGSGVGHFNDVVGMVAPTFAPHGSSGFRYTNPAHKILPDPRNPSVLWMIETADEAVLIGCDGNPIEGTGKSKVEVRTCLMFNDDAKVYAIQHDYDDKHYMEQCAELAKASFLQLTLPKEADRPALPALPSFPDLPEQPDFQELDISTSSFTMTEVEPTMHTTVETLMPDDSGKVVKDGEVTAYLQADLKKVRAQYKS